MNIYEYLPKALSGNEHYVINEIHDKYMYQIK